MADSDRIKKRQIDRFTSFLFPRNGLSPEAAQNILSHMDKKSEAATLSNVELAEQLIDSDAYGTTTVLSDDMVVMDEIIRRLLNGKIPEGWEVD